MGAAYRSGAAGAARSTCVGPAGGASCPTEEPAIRRAIAPLFALAACTGGRTPPPPPAPAPPAPDPAAALVVLVVVDQLGTVHLDRAGDQLPGGFARLLGGQAWRGVATHAHAKTETCPGHVTLATGAAPSVHGIPSNRFQVDGERTYCGDLGLLRAESIGDVFSGAGGAVVSLSLKDRSAIFLAGRAPTLAAWVDGDGAMVQRPPGATEATPVAPPLVSPEAVRGWLAEPWTPLSPEAVAGQPAESAYEVDHDMGAGFPKRPAAEALPGEVGTALKYTPAGGTYLTAAALEAVSRHGLGADETPDLLTVSYSHFDGIGHAHTPASQESVDALFRLDRELATLMDGLDARVGAGRWSLVLTGDHGAPPVAPSYVDLEPLPDTLSAALSAAGLPDRVQGDGHGLWLDPALTPEQRARAVDIVRQTVSGIAGVEAVVTPGDLAPNAPFADAYLEGFVPGRSAEIELLLAENHVALYPPVGERGTDHGCPRAYDRDVPLLAFGARVAPGTGRVDTRDVAPSLAAAAGLRAPADATGAIGPWIADPGGVRP